MNKNPLLESLQVDLFDHTKPLSSILIKAQVLAHQLKSEEFNKWVLYELDGYKDKDIDFLPDYRRFTMMPIGTLTNRFGRTIPDTQVALMLIPVKLQDELCHQRVMDGVTAVETYAGATGAGYTIAVKADYVRLLNAAIKEELEGYLFTELHYPVNTGHFQQILTTIRRRLISFISELSDTWHTREVRGTEPERTTYIFHQIIQNSAQGGNVTFNQQGQSVAGNQYNAGNDINIQSIENQPELIAALTQIRAQLEQVEQDAGDDIDIVIEANSEIRKALAEAKKPEANKGKIKAGLESAMKFLEPIGKAASAVTAIVKLIEMFP